MGSNLEIVHPEDFFLAGDFGADDEHEAFAACGASDRGGLRVPAFDLADELLPSSIDDLIKAHVVAVVHTALSCNFEADVHGAGGDGDLAGAEYSFVALVVDEEGVFLHLKHAFGARGGPRGSAVVRGRLIGEGELFLPREAVLGLGVEHRDGYDMFFRGAAGVGDAGSESVVACGDAAEGVSKSGLGGGVDELAVVTELDFDRISIGGGRVDGDGEIGGCFDFSQVQW